MTAVTQIPPWLFDELADRVRDLDELERRLRAWAVLLDGAEELPNEAGEIAAGLRLARAWGCPSPTKEELMSIFENDPDPRACALCLGQPSSRVGCFPRPSRPSSRSRTAKC